MSLIALKDLSLTRSAMLFSGLSVSIAKADRLGLVAPSGRGKSSLLRILAGQEKPTTGSMIRARGLVAALAPQEPPAHLFPLSLYEAVRDALNAKVANTESWRIDVLLDDLAVDEGLRTRAVQNLPGGWQRIVLLARAAVVEPDLLLLDEPTNHLDIGRIGVLERFLAALPRDCAVVAASNDRAFLDHVTTRTLFLGAEKCMDLGHSYSRALAALEERDAGHEQKFPNGMRKVRTLRQQPARLKNIGIISDSDPLVVKTKQISKPADLFKGRRHMIPATGETAPGFVVCPVRLGMFSQDGRKLVLRPGDAVVISHHSDPARVRITAGSHCGMSLSLTTLAPRVGNVQIAYSQEVPRLTEAMTLIAKYFDVLQQNVAFKSPGRVSAAPTRSHDLAPMKIGATYVDSEIAVDRGIRAVRLAAIKADVRADLANVELSVTDIASRHGITPRYVHMLFEADGVSFRHFLLRERLALVHRMLSDPNHDHLTITMIAMDAGFGDLSYFNRAFRRRYGATPREVRCGNVVRHTRSSQLSGAGAPSVICVPLRMDGSITEKMPDECHQE